MPKKKKELLLELIDIKSQKEFNDAILNADIGITTLEISNCDITEIPNIISRFKKLEMFVMENCPNLNKISVELFNLPNISRISLYELENLKQLPEPSVTKIYKEISLGNMNIREIPSKLSSATKLYITNNKKLEKFYNSPSLEALYIEGNGSKLRFPDELWKNPNLKTIEILDDKYNLFNTIPKTGLIPKLKIMTDNDTYIVNINGELEKIVNQNVGPIDKTILDIDGVSNNDVEDMIINADDNLIELTIKNITDLYFPDLSRFKSLNKLIIRDCSFINEHELKNIGVLTNLEDLRLRNLNRLKKIPDELSNLVNLKQLEITNIILTYYKLSDKFSKLDKLHYLVLNSTNISYIPIFPNLTDLSILFEKNTFFDEKCIINNKSIKTLHLMGDINSTYKFFDKLRKNVNQLNKDIEIDYNSIGYHIKNGELIASSKKGMVDCVIQTWTNPVHLSPFQFEHIHKYYNIQGLKITSHDDMCNIIEKYSPGKLWYNSIKNYYSSLDDKSINTLLDYTFVGDRIINTFYRNGLIHEISKFRGEYNTSQLIFRDITIELLDELQSKNVITINGNDIIKPGSMDNEIKDFNLDTNEKIIGYLFDVILGFKPEEIYDFVSDFFIGQVIVLAAGVITDIFISAPPLDKDILVFRGVKSDLFIKDKTITSTGILSTSFSPLVAEDFSGNNGYIQTIFVSKGTRCIPLFISKYSQENEVIFSHGSKLTLYDCVIGNTRYGKNTNLCEVELRENIEKIDPVKFLDVKNWT